MKRIAAVLRQHWPFFLIVPILIIVTTWPTTAYIFDLNTLWLPSDVLDLGMKFWDAWYAERILAGKADYYFTDFLFFPIGLSLVYHNFSVPHTLLVLGARIFLPPTNAYILINLLIILANAVGCYIYLFYLFRDRWLGMFGSVVFGLSVFVVESSPIPDLSTVASMPLTLYCVQRGLTERRRRWMVLAGLLAGLTAFTGMYIFVCLLISVGVFLCFMLPKLWKDREFWLGLLLLLAVAGSISALRIYPMMRDSAALGDVLNKGGGREHASDVLDYFVHGENVITEHVFASVLRKPIPPVREGRLSRLRLAALGCHWAGKIKTAPRNSNLVRALVDLHSP